MSFVATLGSLAGLARLASAPSDIDRSFAAGTP